MQVWAIGCWRNEADIARVNVCHHLSQGVDRFLLLDDGSSDHTFDVLQDLARRYPLECRRYAGPFRQDALLTALAREAIERGADWVIPIDADEFWYAPQSDLRSVLEGTTTNALRAPVVNFVQQRSQVESGNASCLLTMSRTPVAAIPEQPEARVETGALAFVEYPYPPKWIVRATGDVTVGWGNHIVTGSGLVPADSPDIVCLHAPLRSRATLAAKAGADRPGIATADYLQVAWHVRRWRAVLAAGALDAEWRANSYEFDALDLYGSPRPVIRDTRLADLVRPWITFESPSGYRPELAPHVPPEVRVWGITVVRNEADIIAVNLRHHLAIGLERILVIDNGSTDGSDGVLRELSASEPRIEWRRDGGPFRQDVLVSALAREAFHRGATWVLPFDADEFWHPVPPTDLKSLLSSTNYTALRCEVVNFVQDRGQLESRAEALLTMTSRPVSPVGPPDRGRELVEAGVVGFVEAEYHGKWVCRTAPFLALARGSHAFTGLDAPVSHTDQLVCLHAPIRSRALLTAKMEHGGRLNAQNLPEAIGWHVRRWHGMKSEAAREREWRANSAADGCLDVGARTRPLIADNLLRDVIRASLVFDPDPPPPQLPGSGLAAVSQTPDPDVADLVGAMADVDGWLTDEEALVLARTVVRASMAHGHLPVVELGSYLGRSTVLLARARRASGGVGCVYAIDPHTGATGAIDSPVGLTRRSDTYARFVENIARHGLASFVVPVRLASYDVRWARPIGMLYLDGLHDWVSVREDTRCFEPWLATSGLLAFHDARGPFPGVTRLVAELLAGGRFELVDEAGSLVVLCKLRPETGASS